MPLSVRLMPHAAHKRSDRVWIDRDFSEKERADCLLLNASITGMPPSVLGAGSWISCAIRLILRIKPLIIKQIDFIS